MAILIWYGKKSPFNTPVDGEGMGRMLSFYEITLSQTNLLTTKTKASETSYHRHELEQATKLDNVKNKYN